MSFWVSSCHLFGGPVRGVTFGGSGVSIGGVGSLRVVDFRVDFMRFFRKFACRNLWKNPGRKIVETSKIWGGNSWNSESGLCHPNIFQL